MLVDGAKRAVAVKAFGSAQVRSADGTVVGSVSRKLGKPVVAEVAEGHAVVSPSGQRRPGRIQKHEKEDPPWPTAALPLASPCQRPTRSRPRRRSADDAALPEVPAGEPASRDILIGGGVLLVLLVAYFFAKNAYANMLVGRRVEPRSANAAGWWLFIFLALISVGVVLAAVNRSALMAPFIVGPLALGALVALVLMLLSGRR